MAEDLTREFFKLRGPWRASVALALQIAFFAIPISIVLGLVAIAAFTYQYSPGSGLRAALAAVVVAAIVGVGLHTVLRTSASVRGVPLERKAQPQLWKMAESLASAVGAPAPDEIRITSDPTTQVHQHTRLLGLRVRARCLEIGLPLIAGLNVGELRAVVAHEIGRLVGRSKLSALACRMAISVERTRSALTNGPVKWLFSGYARVYAAVAAPIGVQLDLDADTISLKVTGKRTAITALRKRRAIELGWSEYADEYLSMAPTAERTPDVVLGFRSFLEHQQRKPQLAERTKQAIADEPESDHGDFLTVRERIEVMKRQSGRDRDEDDRPALGLLRDPRKSVPALENRLMVDGLGPRVPWPELARMAGAARVAQQAALLSSAVSQSGVSQDPALGGILACIHRGQGPELVNPVLNPGLDPDKLDEAAVDTLTDLLGDTVVDALVVAGRAHHELDWAGPSHVRLASGRLLDPDRLVRPAVADPRLVPGLHRTLVELGVPLNHSRPPAGEPVPKVAGIVSTVDFARGRYDLLVTDRGLLLVPTTSTPTQRMLAGVVASMSRAAHEQLDELAATPIEKLREQPDSLWVDSRDVASGSLLQQRGGWSLRLELYLDEYSMSSLGGESVTPDAEGIATVRLQSTGNSEERGDPYGGLGEMMGARMEIDDTKDDRDE